MTTAKNTKQRKLTNGFLTLALKIPFHTFESHQILDFLHHIPVSGLPPVAIVPVPTLLETTPPAAPSVPVPVSPRLVPPVPMPTTATAAMAPTVPVGVAPLPVSSVACAGVGGVSVVVMVVGGGRGGEGSQTN